MPRQDQDYERFVQNVYQTLLKAEGKETVQVKHNIKLKGVSGQEHQIDVYWEYKQAGIVYRTAVECKCYRSKVVVGKIRDFSGLLQDIPGLRGIFATKVGYQSGAIKFSKTYGIELLIIREPDEQDYDWKKLNIEYLAPYAKLLGQEFRLIGDLDYYQAKGVSPEEFRVSVYGDGTNILIEDRVEGKQMTMLDIQQELSSSAQSLIVGEQYHHVFPNENTIFDDAWLHFPKDILAEPIKILQLHVPFTVEKGFWLIELENVTENHHVVVKDAIKEEHTFYDSEGKETGKKFRY